MAFLDSTTALLLASAGIAALALAHQVYLGWAKGRPSLRIRATTGRESTPGIYQEETDTFLHPEDHLAIKAKLSNTGEKPVTIAEALIHPLFGPAHTIELRRPYNRTNRLDGHSSEGVWSSLTDIAARLWRIDRLVGIYRLEVRDHAGQSWRSNYVRVGMRR